MLSKPQIKYLRTQAHKLKPVVMVGINGVTESLLAELDSALNAHELIKVKIRCEEREEKQQIIAVLCQKSQAEAVQSIGNNLTMFRQNKKQSKFILPK